MTSRERVALALKHEEADRIPYDLGGTTVTSITRNAYQAAMKARGMSTEYDVNEVDPISQIVTPIEENLVALKSDTRRIGAMRIPEYHKRKIADGKFTRVTDYYGCDWEMQEGHDLYFNQKTCPLENFSSISDGLPHLPRPDLVEFHSILRKDLDRQIGQMGEYACVADRHVAGFTENSVRIRGYENWYMDTVMDPDGVDRLISIVLEDKLTYWDELIDWAIENGQAERIQIIAECDDLGTQSSTILDPDVLRTLVIPRLKTLFTHVKKRLPHVKVFMHTCGSVRELLPDLIEAGMDILNPVQFTAAHMDLAGLKRDFGKDLTFWGGGVDTQSVLNNGSPEEVSNQVKRIIDILAPGGGFVFAPVHNVQDDVSPDNFWAMWDALQEYGKY